VEGILMAVTLAEMEEELLGDEWNRSPGDRVPPIGAAGYADFAGAAEIVSRFVRKPEGADDHPQAGNTGVVISQSRVDGLHHPSKYLQSVRPTAPDPYSETVHTPHWSQTDPELFASLPQGGGGIDWCKVVGHGKLDDRGIALCESLRQAKKLMTCKEDAKARCAELGLEMIGGKYREFLLFAHPYDEGRSIRLAATSVGVGRAFQPLLLHIDGVIITYGRITDSTGKDGKTRGPLCTIEITGITFLRLGETGAFVLAERICRSLGMSFDRLGATRIDACADMPDMSVDTFCEAYRKGQLVTKAKAGANVQYSLPDRDGVIHAETFTIRSKAVSLTVYNKAVEVLTDQTDEKRKLMVQNRWGSEQHSAVRVEWSFRMSKNKAKRYSTFEGLLRGIGDLLGWAMNTWARFVDVKDRTHTTRAVMCDHWLRTLHAFAFWAHRLGERPVPPNVQTAPAGQLLKQAFGCIASAMGRAGKIPTDDFTVFELMNNWRGPNALAAACRERAIEFMAMRGVSLANVFVSEAVLEARDEDDDGTIGGRRGRGPEDRRRPVERQERIPF
jgi:hypothetical protein